MCLQSAHLSIFQLSWAFSFLSRNTQFSLKEFWKFFFLLCYLAALHTGDSFVTISAISPWLSSKYINFEF